MNRSSECGLARSNPNPCLSRSSSRARRTFRFWFNPRMRAHGDYLIQEGVEVVDFPKVWSMLTETYWSPGIPIERVQRAAENSSLVVGAFHEGEQVAYLRVVSDRTTFAWICDVIVGEAHRGKGLATAMTQYAIEHPEHQGLRRWILATRDAHPVYRKCGFTEITNPERWMAHFPRGSIGPV